MKVIILTLCLVLAINGIAPRNRIVAKTNVRMQQFENWAREHNKSYASEQEKSLRFQNFKATLERIEKKNRRSKSATYALNKFSDMSVQEFKETVLMKPVVAPNDQMKRRNQLSVNPKETTAPPSSYDWRNYGKVTPVKNQEQCGSCWAFSATENIESVYMLTNKINGTDMSPLSPQQIVDCDTSDDGCGGGYPTTAYQYVIQAGGLDTAKSYPYTGEDGTCAFKPADVGAKISNWKYACTDSDESQMATNLVNWAPLSICVDAEYWQDYSSGVLTAWECAWVNTLDHCVQAVGFNLAATTPYWIVRNSWGTSWGISGYIYLEYGTNTCGLTQMVTTSTM